MKLRALAVSLFVLGSTLPALADDAAVKVASDAAAKWVASYNANDAAGIAALFAPDGLYNAPSGTVLKTHADLTAYLGSRMGAWPKEAVAIKDAGRSGDMIWASGEFSLDGAGDNAGKQLSGHFGEVFVRSGDAWLIVMLTSNITPPKK